MTRTSKEHVVHDGADGLQKAKAKDCLIVSMFSKRETPYVTHYEDALNDCGSLYDIVYFERYDDEYIPKANEMVFRRYCPTGGSKLKKMKPILSYIRFIRKALKNGQYKFVIILTTLPAFFLADILLAKYRNNFIFDIRDFTYENYAVFRQIEKAVINASYATILSSEGFLSFLPDGGKYFFTHNAPANLELQINSGLSCKKNFVVGFVGSVRYEKENIALIDQFKDDLDVSFGYWGTEAGGCNLADWCGEYPQIALYGPFANEDKPEIYQKIDLINSIYGSSSRETTTAVPNRFYDAAIYGKPIVVSKGTYLATLVDEYNLGFAVDVFRDDVPLELERYLSTFESEKFEEGRCRLLRKVQDDFANQRRIVEDIAKENLSSR